jgi:4-diphosphocytidyl-2C-methyl-D-erythritol kinase
MVVGYGGDVTPQARVERAPGKVNLSLLIGPRRPDGYHDLFTVFVPLDRGDELTLSLDARPRRGGAGAPAAADRTGASALGADETLRVVCPGVPMEGNLVTKAVRLLEEVTGWVLSGEVAIDKRLPVAAGLGGGSSDAARALLAGAAVIEAHGGPGLPRETLRTLALRLGADVPFFLDPRPSLARGVGEDLEALPLPRLPLVLVASSEGLPTASVYREFDRLHPGGSQALFTDRSRQSEEAWRGFSRDHLAGAVAGPSAVLRAAALLENDLGEVAVRLLPGLAGTTDRLVDAGALGVLVSGSGPTLFGLWPSEGEAARAAASLEAGGLRAQACVAGGPDPAVSSIP